MSSEVGENKINDKEHQFKVKSITSTNSHINKIFLLGKQNPFNERRASCASFIIKCVIARFITKVPREKTKLLLGLVNFQ
jgi:hypothetical protein